MMKKLLNPFEYLPLRQAICWGVVAMILTSIFMWQVGLRALCGVLRWRSLSYGLRLALCCASVE